MQLELLLIQLVSNTIRCHFTKCAILLYVDITVRFINRRFTGSESAGFVLVTLELLRGTSSNAFNVAVTPSERSSVSAKSNSACNVYDYVLTEECLTNRWC